MPYRTVSRSALPALVLLVLGGTAEAGAPLTGPVWTVDGGQAAAGDGVAVTTAGDVNGDGYSDVLVGAPFFDNGHTDEGRVRLFLGAASGLAPTAAWSAEGDQANANFGKAAAPAGDVNGDGYQDVIVGAYLHDNGHPDEGQARLYLGSASGLAPSPAWTNESNQAIAQFGHVVGTAGDVNGDGFDDVVVSAYRFTNGEAVEGKVWVYHGSASGLSPAASWSVEGNQPGAQAGYAAGTAGDVNGDGYADLLVGLHGYDNGHSDEGRAELYLGGPSGLAAAPAWTAEPNQAGALFGHTVCGIGDVNGDGFADIAVGVRGHTNGQAGEGGVFIYHGGPGGPGASPARILESDQSLSEFAVALSTAGDVNRDGYADLVVGAPQFDNDQSNEGRVFLYLGSATGLSATAAWTAESNQADSFYGFAVGTAADVDGDGGTEILVGAPGFDSTFGAEGRAWLHRNAVNTLPATPGWIASGTQGHGFGGGVHGAGDVNGDGYSDFLVGDHLFDNGHTDEGALFLYTGGPAGPGATPAWSAEGGRTNAYMGKAAGPAGDVNGDGYGDVIVGIETYSNGQPWEGQARLYYGSPAGLAVTAAWTLESNDSLATMGTSVSTAGDVNGDGFADVIVGVAGRLAPPAHPISRGHALVFHGSAVGLSELPNWQFEGSQLDEKLGIAVSTAGDVNGDGFSDVVVGANGYDNGQLNEGRILVFHGSPTGLASSPSKSIEGNADAANFGERVACAGDVDGDHYSDIVVGTPRYGTTYTGSGAAWLYRGSGMGTESLAAWSVEGTEDFMSVGEPVGSAGDVNGDGYSDILIGLAEDFAQPQQRAWVFFGSPSGPTGPNWIADTAIFGSDLGATSGAGDVNGDGFSDILVGLDEPFAGPGQAWLYYGNETPGRGNAPRQLRAGAAVPIHLLGRSDSESSFRLESLAVSPAGRQRVRLQYEIKPLGTAFNGTAVVTGPLVDSGAPASPSMLTESVVGLAPDGLYRWRLRLLGTSPYFPRSHWYAHAGNATTESDLRTAPSPSGVEDRASAPPARFLGPNAPNPFSRTTRFAWTLPEPGHVRVSVHDVLGREVVVLVDGEREAGRYVDSWDGAGTGGRPLAAGTYFVRLAFGSIVEASRLVLAR